MVAHRPRSMSAAAAAAAPARTAIRRVRARWRRYRRLSSPFVHQYLDGLRGIEIGASSHNSYYLNAINVDRYESSDSKYKEEERSLVGIVAPIDIAAHGDELPFKDKSSDFVFASHVIEHFPDPIKALGEWLRVAARYVVLVVPHRDRTFDADRDLTSVEELLARHAAGMTSIEDRHWSVWTCESFLELCGDLGLTVVAHQDPDDQVGNGFIVIIDAAQPVTLPVAARH